MIFERIRKMCDITNEMYQRSVSPEQLLMNLIMGNLSTLSENSLLVKVDPFFTILRMTNSCRKQSQKMNLNFSEEY